MFSTRRSGSRLPPVVEGRLFGRKRQKMSLVGRFEEQRIGHENLCRATYSISSEDRDIAAKKTVTVVSFPSAASGGSSVALITTPLLLSR